MDVDEDILFLERVAILERVASALSGKSCKVVVTSSPRILRMEDGSVFQRTVSWTAMLGEDGFDLLDGPPAVDSPVSLSLAIRRLEGWVLKKYGRRGEER